MMLAVRQALSLDVPALVNIDRQSSESPWTESQFRSACDADGSSQVLVAEQAGQIAGFAVYQQVLDEVSLHTIAVARNWRRTGVGRILMAAMLEHSRAQGASRCLLEVRVSNTAAIALYRAFKFTEDGVRLSYYPVADGGREDALLMSLPLDASV